MGQLPMWQEKVSNWEQQAERASTLKPLKGLRRLPNMVGITSETAKNLKAKSFWYMLRHDDGSIRRHIMRHPFRYGFRLFKSLLRSESYKRKGDCFFYGTESLEEFKKELSDPDALFVIGFSYCHKPFECPSGRFTDQCVADKSSSVCQQCFIGKCMHLKGENALPLVIPTVHYIGEKILDLVHANPDKKIIFLITACEMTLKMFGDWGNMAGIKGIGIRLDGRICNTMRAFELSEKGIKPGLTVVLPETQQKILDLLAPD